VRGRLLRDSDLSPAAPRVVVINEEMAPAYGIATVEQRYGRTVALRRLQTLLLATLPAVALILALIGAYGVIRQSVAARTQEIGIRMALGASTSTVLWMVLTGGLGPAIAGLVLGLGAAARRDDHRMSRPPRRAARFDPVTALRQD
jgi:ABC-type lipoprotein release transport system permease subunit